MKAKKILFRNKKTGNKAGSRNNELSAERQDPERQFHLKQQYQAELAKKELKYISEFASPIPESSSPLRKLSHLQNKGDMSWEVYNDDLPNIPEFYESTVSKCEKKEAYCIAKPKTKAKIQKLTLEVQNKNEQSLEDVKQQSKTKTIKEKARPGKSFSKFVESQHLSLFPHKMSKPVDCSPIRVRRTNYSSYSALSKNSKKCKTEQSETLYLLKGRSHEFQKVVIKRHPANEGFMNQKPMFNRTLLSKRSETEPLQTRKADLPINFLTFKSQNQQATKQQSKRDCFEEKAKSMLLRHEYERLKRLLRKDYPKNMCSPQDFPIKICQVQFQHLH